MILEFRYEQMILQTGILFVESLHNHNGSRTKFLSEPESDISYYILQNGHHTITNDACLNYTAPALSFKLSSQSVSMTHALPNLDCFLQV
jgi:hypothetical protein